MATSLSGAVTLQISMNYQNALDNRNTVDALSKSYSMTLTNGTAANQATVLWADTRSTNDTGETLDFNGGGLVNSFGLACPITMYVAVVIASASANTTNIAVTQATAGGLFLANGDGILIPPGGWWLIAAPGTGHLAATAGTLDLLGVKSATAGTVSYDIIVIGA